MKFIIVLFTVIYIAMAQPLSDKEKAIAGKYYSECVAATNVNEDLIKKMRAGEFTDDNYPLKKYIDCMFTKFRFVNSEGELQMDVIKTKIPSHFNQEEALKNIAECKDVKGSDVDSIFYEAYKCFVKKMTTNKLDV